MPDPNAPPNANASPAAATAAGAPMLVFGTPVQQVTGTPAGGGAAAAQAISANSGQPRPAPASVAVPAGPAAPDPHYIPTPNASGPTAAPSAPTMAPPPGYPGAAVGATAPYVPPPAPEPYQAAAAAPGGAQGYHFYNSYLEDEQRFQNRPPEYQNYYYGPGRCVPNPRPHPVPAKHMPLLKLEGILSASPNGAASPINAVPLALMPSTPHPARCPHSLTPAGLCHLTCTC